MLRVAEEGGGFHRYLWNKPFTGRDEEKLSYVVRVPPWNWMMGTGLYIDDIAREVLKIRSQVDISIRNTFFTLLVVVVGTVILIALVGIAINLHESKLADIRLRELAHKSVRIQVSERRRFARELHDGINQLMVSVKFRFESAINKIEKGQNSPVKDLVSGNRVLNDAIQEVRRISRDLRPRLLDDTGLRVALKSLIGQFKERTNISTEMVINISDERLPEDIEITIYRLVQEALTNIERHAGVCNVALTLRQSRGVVTLIVEDYGQGFEPATDNEGEGIGLRNMRERIELLDGNFSIQSNMGEGTRLRAILPSEVA